LSAIAEMIDRLSGVAVLKQKVTLAPAPVHRSPQQQELLPPVRQVDVAPQRTLRRAVQARE
jgi:hypothetical protein